MESVLYVVVHWGEASHHPHPQHDVAWYEKYPDYTPCQIKIMFNVAWRGRNGVGSEATAVFLISVYTTRLIWV